VALWVSACETENEPWHVVWSIFRDKPNGPSEPYAPIHYGELPTGFHTAVKAEPLVPLKCYRIETTDMKGEAWLRFRIENDSSVRELR
jgi:hypothetical protein